MLERRALGEFDWVLMSAMLAATGLGLLMLYSSTYLQGGALFYRQLAWLGVALAGFAFVVSVDYRFWAGLAIPAYITCCVLLVVVLFTARVIQGTRSWLEFGAFNFQPAELAKLATIMMLARYVEEKKGFGLTGLSLLALGGIVALPVLLIMAQPDLGSTLPFLPLMFVIVVLSGIRWKVLMVLGLIGILMVPVGFFMLKPYQQERVRTFMDPMSDPQGAGWQVLQSRIAVGSGGLWGKGLFGGSQGQLRFLPESHTDFILSVLGEELGFAGAACALVIYFVLLSRIVSAARSARDRLGAFICMGVAAVIGSQSLVNIGVILGLMPTTGIPMPLMSYGGSSLVTTFVALGLVLNVRMRCLVN
ncbi:MAG TPA: rod shape-determining protein RodA [Candidatus Polarisedimenticolia bacterium]|nr:rod shape-determining protein RodA [Candidatus Polarisedimenticolia bacterium]